MGEGEGEGGRERRLFQSTVDYHWSGLDRKEGRRRFFVDWFGSFLGRMALLA